MTIWSSHERKFQVSAGPPRALAASFFEGSDKISDGSACGRGVCKEGVTGPQIDALLYPLECLFIHLDICFTTIRSTDEQSNDALETYKEEHVEKRETCQ